MMQPLCFNLNRKLMKAKSTQRNAEIEWLKSVYFKHSQYSRWDAGKSWSTISLLCAKGDAEDHVRIAKYQPYIAI